MDAAALGIAAGSVLYGLGTFLAAANSIRSAKRRAHDDCERRITEINKALERGMKLERRRER